MKSKPLEVFYHRNISQLSAIVARTRVVSLTETMTDWDP